jgi:DNA modification methylase
LEFINQILLGKWEDLLPKIPDHSIDLVLTDPPYGEGSTGLEWDKCPDLKALWQEYGRVIKPVGAIVITATMPFGAKLINSKPDWFKYDLIWRKQNGNSPGLAKYRPLPVHEHVFIFSPKKAKITYNAQMRLGFAPWSKVNNNSGGKKACKNVKYGYNETPFKESGSDQRYPISVIEVARPNYNDHPTQKPVGLYEWLIKTYSNPGETVLDNFAGSGTTAEAAYNTGRNFIAIEMLEKYHTIACERMKR